MPVCITGMHRSGTSMVAKMLNSCDLCLGAESALVAPSRDNPGGYWENKDFVSINNEILGEFGSSWDYPRRLPDGWQFNQKMLRYRARVEVLLQGLEDHEPWGWKDPRACLTLPFWMNILPQTKVIICLRNPLEVVLSLHQRKPSRYTLGLAPWRVYDLFHAPFSSLRKKFTPHPLGFTAWKTGNKVKTTLVSRTSQDSSLRRFGLALTERRDRLDFLLKLRRRRPFSYRIGLQLWEIYNRRVLEFTCPQNRLITHYDAYFSNPQGELHRVLNFLEIPASDELIERGCATAIAGLRHHRTTTLQLIKAGVPAEVRELYRRMCEESEYVED
ncbi:MAG: sulfotransferase [Acidobacteriota bacterium]|nr:sulfotransferase [Acidobacteriota bacterium]